MKIDKQPRPSPDRSDLSHEPARNDLEHGDQIRSIAEHAARERLNPARGVLLAVGVCCVFWALVATWVLSR